MSTVVASLDMAAENRGSADLDRCHHAPLNIRQRRAKLLPIVLSVAAEDVRHFQLPVAHGPDAQKCLGGSGFGSTETGRGNRSRGLVVEQTLLVAILK
jgi:hypothetical protein